MRKLSLALLLISLALCLNASADTITLKDGTVIEGTIVQQDDSQVTINVKESEAISSDRILKVSEIAKIDKTAEDGLAFEQLKDLKPDPWRTFSAEEYAGVVARLKGFLDKYPASTHAHDVQAILDSFLDEQARQKAGDVKLYGRWIPSQEALARDTEIKAQGLYLNMEAAKARGDVSGALNVFNNLEKSYNGTRVYPVAVGEASVLIESLANQIPNAVSALKVKEDRFTQGVAITPEPDKSVMIAARKTELAQYDALMASAVKAQLKWPPFIPDSQKSLDAIAKLVSTERARLAALPVDKMNDSLAESDKAAESFAAGDLAAADAHLKNATALWSVNEEAAYLQKTIATAKTALAHPPKPTPQQSKALAPRATPTPGSTASAAPGESPKPASTPAPAAVESDTKQKVIDFLFTIPGAITVLVCILGLVIIASFLQKSKRDRMDRDVEHDHDHDEEQ